MANPAIPPETDLSGSSLPASSSPTQSSLPSPPFITVAGIPNFRTIGGYASTLYPGHRVRSDLIYRSAITSRIQEPGIKTMTDDLNIKTIFDLRSSVESAKMGVTTPKPSIPGVSILETPVFPDSEWTDRTRMKESWKQYTDPIDEILGYSKGFLQGYQRIASSAGPAYAQVLRHLLASNIQDSSTVGSPPKAILFHCTAGKDRTGVLTAIILKLCGVDHGTIAHEYSLTEAGLSEWREIIIQKLLEEDNYGGDHDSDEHRHVRRQQAERMLSSKRENIEAFLRWVDDDFGGAEGWLTGKAGLSGEEVEGVRTLLLIKEEYN